MGRISRLVGDAAANLLFHAAEIVEVVDHGGGLRSIRLAGEELQGLTWTPGDKVQVQLDGLTTRTYTPTAWDARDGRTALFAFNHGGDGPGDAWVSNAEDGVRCHLFGPRKSLSLLAFDAPPVMVGDETSFALSLAWRTHSHDEPPRAEVFEVNDVTLAQAALATRGIHGATLIQRLPDDAHLPELKATVADAAAGASALCITGKVQTIAALRSHLKDSGISVRQTTAKAYWDTRRAGLD